MKKSRFRILMALTVAIVLLVTVFTISSLAESKYAEVTFVQNGSSYKQAVLKGEEITLPTPTAELGGNIYGWFDTEGNLYSVAEKIKPQKNLTLYCAEGDSFSLSGVLPIYCQKGYTYIKLNSNITLDSPVVLPNNTVVYIDLNGNTMNIETPACINESTGSEVASGAFVGKNSGVVFANSSVNEAKIVHTSLGDSAFSLGSLVLASPSDKANALSFVVKENVSIKTNMSLFSIDSDISEMEGNLNISIYGDVECGKLLRSSGLNGGKITIHNTAKIVSNQDYMIEDITQNTSLLTLTVMADSKKIVNEGGVDVEKEIVAEMHIKNGFIKNSSRISVLVYGGRYSKNIASMIPNNSYTFENRPDDDNELYYFASCMHSGPLAEHAYVCQKNCTQNHEHYFCNTPRKLKHSCVYCGEVYEKDYPEGVGHSLKMELIQEPINTKEETKEGMYKTYCTRGDYEKYETAYPNPDSVYITVKYIDKTTQEEVTLRVPSKDVYSFDKTNKTKISSFSVDNVYTLDADGNSVRISPDTIFFVEVPSGTTDIYGVMQNRDNTPTPVGAFANDYYIKEIALPTSIINIDSYAFFNMQSIEKITGIENITGTIGTGAFMQPVDTKLSFDYFELNASSVGNAAFGNILITKSLTIGENVSSIGNNAFGLGLEMDSDNGNIVEITDYEDKRTEDEITKEVFVVGYEGNDGVTLGAAKSGMGSYHQFSTLPIVFKSHDYVLSQIPATCISFGHDLHTCSRCSASYQDNFVEEYADHALAVHIVPATCQKYGFKGQKCTIEGCGYIVKDAVGGDLPIDKNNHTYAASTVKYPIDPNGYFCVDPYYTLKRCGCGKIQPDTESTIKFSYPGSSSPTSWVFYLLEDNTVLIYKDGKKLATQALGNLTIVDGYFSVLTYNSLTFNLVKTTGDVSEDDKLSGTYTASNDKGISFTVTVSVGTRCSAVIPGSDASHTFNETVLIEPTCDYGKIRKTCTSCKYTPADTIVSPVATHTLEKVILQEATCSIVESGKYVCSVCGVENPYTFEGKYDTTKHTKKVNDEGVVVAEPSTQYPGQRRFQCKDCGADIFEEIPKLEPSNEKSIRTTLIIIFISIPLAAGIILTFVFTFTKKKSKAAGYKFRFNTIKNGEAHSNKTVAEQLAEMNLTEELPPDVELSEDGVRDDEAAWTAYVDAINNDYTRTIELNLAKETEADTSVDEVKPDSNGNAWEAYVAAINKDYEETMELSINSQQNEEKSLADLMDDTVVDMSFAGYNQDGSSEGEDETFDFGTLSGSQSFDLGSTDNSKK